MSARLWMKSVAHFLPVEQIGSESGQGDSQDWRQLPNPRVAALTSADFYRPVNAALFTAISELVEAGKPHNSAHVFTTLQQEGRTSGHLGKQLTKALTDITTIGVPSTELEHNISAVLTQAYRRGFREAARSLAQAAEELPEDQLFEHLLSIGHERRAASQRLAAIREGRA
ncbi:DnaB-like helicase N-terminal domain-containing protein [Rhodococcus sp. BH5]|uniref:DnaB-like helicase N-terminal domain-containing protein n=1 Tax=Rhodococcus sp. BH5 TaxID=2871702 RepID=UPI0022CD84A4|nr:DnaB-like helicase N-terminal domain-containing protein [Rhodococcus sp. BH5]MCZ9635307.1 DNA helicase [Rhodococcus sp. BH5]